MLTLSPDEDTPQGGSQPLLDSLHHIDEDLSDGFLPGSSDSSPWGLARQPAAGAPSRSAGAHGVVSSLSDDEDLPLAQLAKRVASPAALSRAQASAPVAQSHPSVPNFSQNTTAAAKHLSAQLMRRAAAPPMAHAEQLCSPGSAGTPGPLPPRAPAAALVTPAAQRTRTTRGTHSGSAQRKSRASAKRAPRALQALQAFNVSPSRSAREAATASTPPAMGRELDLEQPATPMPKPAPVQPARAAQVPLILEDAARSMQRVLCLSAACQDSSSWPADLTHLALGYDSVVPSGHAADVAGEVLAVCALQARVTERLPSQALPCFEAMQALLRASTEGQRVAVYFGAAQEWYPATIIGVHCSSAAPLEPPSPSSVQALAAASAACGLPMLQLAALAALANAPDAPLPPVPRAGRRLLAALGHDVQQHASAVQDASDALAIALRRLMDGQAAALAASLLPERIAFDMEFGDGTRGVHALGHSPMLWGPPSSATLSEAACAALAALATVAASAAELGMPGPVTSAAAVHSDASSCSNVWSEEEDASAEDADLEELAARPAPRRAAAESSSQSSTASHATPQLVRRGGLKHSATALPGSSIRRVHFSAQAKPAAPEPAAEDGAPASANPFETPPRTKASGRGAAARARIADVNLSPDELARPSLPGAQYAVLRIVDGAVAGRVVPQADGSAALASDVDQLPASACNVMASTPAGARAAGPLPPGTAAWLVAHGAEVQGIPAYAGILAGASCLPASGTPAAKPAPIPAAQVVCPAVSAIPSWLTQRDYVVILGQTDAVVYCALLGSLDMSQLAGAPLTVVAEIVSSASSRDGHACTVALCAPAHIAPGLAQWCEAELGHAARARGAAALGRTPCASRAFLDELKLAKAMWQARTGLPKPAPELSARQSPNKTSSPRAIHSKAPGSSGKQQHRQAEAHLSSTSLLNALTVTTHRRRSAGAAVVVSDIALHDFVQAAGALPAWGGPATSQAAASTAARAGAKRRRGRGGADPMLNAAALAMAVDPCLRTAKVLWSWAQGSPAVHPAWCVLANHSDAGVRLALSSAAALRAMSLPALLPPSLQQLAGPADAAAQPHAPLHLPHSQRALAGLRLSSMLQAYDGLADLGVGGPLRASPASQGTGWLQRVADTPCPAQVAQTPSSLLEWAWDELLDGGKLIEAAVAAAPVLTGVADEDCERVVQAAAGKYVDVVGLLWLWVLHEAVARGAARHITVAGLASLLSQLGAPVPAQLASRSLEACSLDQVCAALDALSSACPCACLVKPLPMASGALQSSSYRAAGILHALVLAAADALCVPCVGFEWLAHVLGAHAVRAAKQPALSDWHQEAQEQYADAVMQFAVPASWCTHAILSHVVPGFQPMPRLALLRPRQVEGCSVQAAGSLLQPAGSLRCCCEALPGSAHLHMTGCTLTKPGHATARFASGWPVLLGAAAAPEHLHAAPRVLLAGTLEDVVVAVHAQQGPRMYMARVRGAFPAELAGNTGLAQAHQPSLLVPAHGLLAMPSGVQ